MTKKVAPNKESIEVAAEIVLKGGLVVFPWGKLERKCFAIMCDSKNRKACEKLNLIKTRAKDQVLAVNGYPELIEEVAKLEASKPLRAASKKLKKSPLEIIRECMKIGAISFIFEAKDNLSDSVTTMTQGKRTVMVAGEIDDKDYDFYTELVKLLHKKGVVTAGSSANRTLEGTYYLFEQEKAYQDLERDVDLFVYHNPLPKKPLYAMNLQSCTTFNMSVDSDLPEVYRFGSVHPSQFNKIFGGFKIAKDVTYLPRHEQKHHILLKNFLRIFA